MASFGWLMEFIDAWSRTGQRMTDTGWKPVKKKKKQKAWIDQQKRAVKSR